MTQIQSLRSSNKKFSNSDSKRTKKMQNPDSQPAQRKLPQNLAKIQYLKRAFENYFKSQKSLQSEFSIIKSNLQIEQSQITSPSSTKPKFTIRSTVKRHKSSFKKFDIQSEVHASAFFKFSDLIQSEIIPEEFLIDYELLLGLAAQVAIVHRDVDTLDFILTFYDCFLFYESQFRAAWAFYAIYLREFQEAISSLEIALKHDPYHYQSLISYSYIFLSGLTKGGSDSVSLVSALNYAHLALRVKETQEVLHILAQLYIIKGLNEEALFYQIQAYDNLLNTHDLEINFLNFGI